MYKKIIILIFFIVVTLFITNAGFSQTVDQAVSEISNEFSEKIPQESRIAVIDIKSQYKDLSVRVAEELIKSLVNKNLFKVVSREETEKAVVVEEIIRQGDGFYSEESAKKVGRFLTADIIIMGEITETSKNNFRLLAKAIHVENLYYQAFSIVKNFSYSIVGSLIINTYSSGSVQIEGPEYRSIYLGSNGSSEIRLYPGNYKVTITYSNNCTEVQFVNVVYSQTTPVSFFKYVEAYKNFTTGERLEIGFCNLLFGAGFMWYDKEIEDLGCGTMALVWGLNFVGSFCTILGACTGDEGKSMLSFGLVAWSAGIVLGFILPFTYDKKDKSYCYENDSPPLKLEFALFDDKNENEFGRYNGRSSNHMSFNTRVLYTLYF